MTAAAPAAEPAQDRDDRDDGRPWPSAARAWWVIAVFFVAAILYYTDRFILNLLVDPIRAELHISDTQVSLLQGMAFGLVYAFAGLPLGRFADLMPRRTLMIAGVVIWSLATAACGYAHSFGQLFAARVMVGIGEAALAPAAVSMIGDYFSPNRRGAAIGVFLTGMSIGNSMAIIVSGGLLEAANSGLFRSLPLVAHLAPWRAVLVLLALPALVVVGLLLTIREPERRGRKAASGAALPVRAVVDGFVSRRHVLLPLYLAVALASAGDCALLNWTPSLLSRRFAYSPGEIATILGGVSLGMGIVGSLFGGVFSDYLHRRGGSRARLMAATAAGLLAVAGASVALAANGLQVVAIYGLWILMTSISETIGITTIQDVVPNEMRGVGTSLVSFGNILIGMSLGTSLTAIFTDHVYRDPSAVGWSITSVAAPAGLLSALLFWRALRVLTRRPGEGRGLTLDAVLAAARRIAPHVRRTPILALHGGLRLKAENLQPTGSFKIRGAFNSILTLGDAERARGVVAHSSGNHAQAVAYAAARLGVRAVVVMPVDAPAAKLSGVRRWGADIVVVGPASAERSARAQALSAEYGYALVEPYDSDAVIDATGTLGLEILEEAPDTQWVFAPVGGGGLISGLAAAIKQRRPSVRVIGVEPEGAADALESLRAGRVVTLPAAQMAATLADGLRVQRLGARNWPLIRDHVDDVVTVSEAAIRAAMRRIATEACLVAEPSGAVAVAGALAAGVDPARSVAILSGGNLDLALLADAPAAP